MTEVVAVRTTVLFPIQVAAKELKTSFQALPVWEKMMLESLE